MPLALRSGFAPFVMPPMITFLRGRRGFAAGGVEDHAESGVAVLQNQASRQAKHSNALLGEPSVAVEVMKARRVVSMMLAIDFDTEPNLVTVEVQNERSDRVLAAEAQTLSAATQTDPQTHLRRSHPAAERPGAGDRVGWSLHAEHDVMP